jgi:hypothetical protein
MSLKEPKNYEEFTFKLPNWLKQSDARNKLDEGTQRN